MPSAGHWDPLVSGNTEHSVTALACITGHLSQAFKAGENTSPALKGLRWEKHSSEIKHHRIHSGRRRGLVDKHGRGSKLANSFVIIPTGTSC